MKKIILLLFIFFLVNNSLSARAESTIKQLWHAYLDSVQVVDEDFVESNVKAYDCRKHFIKKITTTKKYKDDTENTTTNYAAFDGNRRPIVQNCESIEHFVYNNKCYFVISFSDFGTKYAVLKQDNNFIITNTYNSIVSIGDYKFLVKKDNLYGIMDLDEIQSVPIMYKSLSKIKNRFYKAKLNNGYGVVSIDGKVIIPCEYSNISKLGDFYFKVKKNDKWGIIDNNGKIIAQVNYKDVKISKNVLYVKNFGGNWVKL